MGHPFQRVADGSKVRVSKTDTMALGIALEKTNVAFMADLVFTVAASVNFPVLLLSMLWGER